MIPQSEHSYSTLKMLFIGFHEGFFNEGLISAISLVFAFLQIITMLWYIDYTVKSVSIKSCIIIIMYLWFGLFESSEIYDQLESNNNITQNMSTIELNEKDIAKMCIFPYTKINEDDDSPNIYGIDTHFIKNGEYTSIRSIICNLFGKDFKYPIIIKNEGLDQNTHNIAHNGITTIISDGKSDPIKIKIDGSESGYYIKNLYNKNY